MLEENGSKLLALLAFAFVVARSFLPHDVDILYAKISSRGVRGRIQEFETRREEFNQRESLGGIWFRDGFKGVDG